MRVMVGLLSLLMVMPLLAGDTENERLDSSAEAISVPSRGG